LHLHANFSKGHAAVKSQIEVYRAKANAMSSTRSAIIVYVHAGKMSEMKRTCSSLSESGTLIGPTSAEGTRRNSACLPAWAVRHVFVLR
jgi:hypothetical protein